MSFDCSRFGFDPRQDFFGVVMQQGRVQLDADWNEWVAELGRRIQAGTLDTLGRAVVPRITPDGFKIGVTGGVMTIDRGRIYVDGLLAENHGAPPLVWDPVLCEQTGSAPVPFSKQPYLPFNEQDAPAPANVFNQPQPDAVPQLVYLDVWQRAVTHLQDPHLIEAALGVDTTGRLQTVWQVRLLPAKGPINCKTPEAAVPDWTALTRPSGARLTIAPGGPPSDPNPCRIPPAATYKGLENQLYRVEIHRGGDLNSATFKWSRDNASVAVAVSEIQSNNRLIVEHLGRDAVLGFHGGDWIEILDDWHELHGRPGLLRRIGADGINDAARSILLVDALPAGLFPVDAQGHTLPERHTRIRRWDQSGPVRRAAGAVFHDLDAAASSDGIPVSDTGTPLALALESGILAEFALESPGEFKTGDYWVFAARAADGSIETLHQAPPRGIHHHYARLALVTLPGTPADCRVLYPPVCTGSPCTFTVAPGPGWDEVFERIPAGGDAEICFGVGDYPLALPRTIANKGHLKLTGAGVGTQILAPQAEQALLFHGCASVLVTDLSAQTGIAGSGTTETAGLSGTLSFESCGAVTLHRVALQCAAAVIRSAACLRILNKPVGEAISADQRHPRATLDVQDCRFEVGSNQLGALVVDATRVLFRNNMIRCRDGRTEVQQIAAGLAKDPVLRAEVRRTLFAEVRPGEPVPGTRDFYDPTTNRRTMLTGNLWFSFRSHPGLEQIDFYRRLFPDGLPQAASLFAVNDLLQDAVDAVLLDPGRIDGFPPIFAAAQAQDLPALYQGIAIGGEYVEEVRIQDNSILDALQGVHIGQSRRDQPQGERLRSTVVTIEGNTIESRITPAINREAYGIFVGNCDSLLVLGNRLRREALASTVHLRMDGIHVAGVLGGRVIVRHNEVLGYRSRINADIAFGADVLIDPESDIERPLWLVADNLAARVEVTNGDSRVIVERNLPGI